MMPTTRITTQQCISTYFNNIGKKYTPCQGVVWSQYRLPGTFYVPLGFYVVWISKVCFFLPVQFCKVVDFTLALLYPNFKLQYFMNYSSDFNNFCRFQLLAVCTILLHTTKAGVFLRTKYGAWHEFSEDTCLRPTIASGRHARATWHRDTADRRGLGPL